MLIRRRRRAGAGCKCSAALAAAAALAIALGAQAAHAQTLDDLVVAAKLVKGTITIGTGPGAFTDSRGFTGEEEDSHGFFSDAYLRATYPGRYTGTEAVFLVMSFRGATFATAEYLPNSTTIRVVLPGAEQPGSPGQPFTLTFTGATRAASVAMLDNYIEFTLPFSDKVAAVRSVFQSLSRYSPVDPFVGNPDSLQGAIIRGALDLAEGGSAIEGGSQSAARDPWLVGFAIAHSASGGFDTVRVSGRFQRAYRVFEGSRTLLKFEAPITYTDTEGARSLSASAAVGLEVPVVENRWSLEPRLLIGASDSEVGTLGYMAAATLASRSRFDVGRGYVLVANMIGYTSTLPSWSGSGYVPKITNTIYRNGVAYEFPLMRRIASRQATVRVSYSYTQLTGTPLFLDRFHEAIVSLGVRNREGDPRLTSDLFRVNISGTFGKDYTSASLGLGYRF